MRRVTKNRDGQAAIEFMVCMVVILFFLMMVLSLAVLFVTSEYMEYATFMAARTYKAAAGSSDEQERNAKEVFDAYAGNVTGIIRNPSIRFQDQGPTDTAGAVASYDIDLFYLPPVFIGTNAPLSRIHLSTDTYLGREPSVAECGNFFQTFVQRFGVSSVFADSMDDNGC